MAWSEKRGNTWRVRYIRDDGTIGSISGFLNKTAADDEAHNIETDTDRGTFRDPQHTITLAEWVELWAETHHVSNNTWAKYHSHLRNHILPQFGDDKLPDIKRINIKRWITRLRKRLRHETVANIATILSMIMREAVEEDLIDKSPCRKLGIGAEPRDEGIAITPTQLQRITQRLHRHDQVLVITAAYTGMRWGELTGLQWHNVNLDTATITIDKDKGALHETAGRLELGPPKTPSSARTLHLPPFLVGLLRLHAGHQHHEHVFTGRDGRLLRRYNFRKRVWRPAVAGDDTRKWEPLVPKMTFHDLRHTHRTWLTEDRIHEVLKYQRMGWRLPGVRGIYDHVTPPMIEALLTTLENRWHGSESENDHLLGRAQHQLSQNPPIDTKTPTDHDHRQGF